MLLAPGRWPVANSSLPRTSTIVTPSPISSLTSEGSTSWIWLLTWRRSSAPDGLILKTPKPGSGFRDFIKCSDTLRACRRLRERAASRMFPARLRLTIAIQGLRSHTNRPSHRGRARSRSGDEQVREADGAGAGGARALVGRLRPPHADGGRREGDARQASAGDGARFAIELPAEDGVEAFDLDADGAGLGGRDLDVDRERFAGRGLGAARRRCWWR